MRIAKPRSGQERRLWRLRFSNPFDNFPHHHETLEKCSSRHPPSDNRPVPTSSPSKHDLSNAHTPWDALAVTPADVPGVSEPEEDAVDQVTVVEGASATDPEESCPPASGGLFTLPLLCLGIGIIACCLLIPAADENRRLAYERQRLQADLDQITKQVEVNNAFLKRVADDPTLSERLAQRQMKMVREGTSVLELKGQYSDKDMSPFELVTLPPPPDMPPYQPVGGKLSTLCRNPRSQLYLMGAGLLLVAAGLVLGSGPTTGTPD